MKLVVDMNLSPDWVECLRAGGHDALHWSQVGPANASDENILKWAAEHDRTILTCDLDFGTMIAISGSSEPSVVQLRLDVNLPARVGSRVLQALSQTEADISSGALVTIDNDRLRLRPLTFVVKE